MRLKHNQAKALRKKLTPPEFKLWHGLKTREADGPVFKRQYAFGPYILDFYCVRARLAVEVDGAHHTEDEAIQSDAIRDAYMERNGVMTYRVLASSVFSDFEDVVDGIWDIARERAETFRKAESA